MQCNNSWNVYSTIGFFEKVLKGHNQVSSFERKNDIEFIIIRNRNDRLDVLLLNEYSLGLAAILRARSEFPNVEYFVTGANWNGYTPEAKEYCSKNNLGIFNLGEFLGSLNWDNPKEYFQKDREGKPYYAYK